MHQTAQSISVASDPLARARTGSIFDRRGARLALWAAISIAFTLAMIQYSFARGRLLMPAEYDDVSYMLDGLQRLEIGYGQGLNAMALDWLRHPPHSPFSTSMAIAAFALFGMHDWGPYALDAVIVFTLLAFIDRLLGNLRLRWKIAAAVVAMCTPIVGLAVVEFRPDMMCGLVTAMLAVVLLDGPILGRRRNRLIAAGALWALCLWVKPSVFPFTLGLGGLALLLGTIRDVWVARPARTRPMDIARAWLLVLLPALVLSLPYYAIGGRAIVHYILINEVGSNRQMWILHADRATSLQYYSLGQGGMAMLGTWFWIFLVEMVLGAALLISRSNRRMWATIACGAMVGIAAYAVPTANPVKQAFLATPFDFLMLFGAILVMRQLTRDYLPSIVGWAGALMAAGMVAVSLHCCGFPGAPGFDRAGDYVRRTRQTVAGVYAVIRDHYRLGQKRVWLNFTGPINTNLLQYTAVKDGIPLHFDCNASATSPKFFRKIYDTCDYVVAADPGVPDLAANLPSNLILDQTLAIIRARPDYQLIATVPADESSNYYIFQKIGLFHGWTKITGLFPLEGPYPKWGMGMVRWGVGSATTIALDAGATGGDSVLTMHAQSQLPNQKMTVLLDGRAIAEHAFKTPGTFDTIAVPLHLSPGQHELILDYATWLHDPAREAALLYSELEVNPATPPKLR